MSLIEKFSEYLRVCKHCNTYFKTIHPRGKVCDKCKKTMYGGKYRNHGRKRL